MPKVFQHPLEYRNTFDTSVFVVAESDGFFDPKLDEVTLENVADEIRDETIFFVTANRRIPWTKPEDLKYGHNGIDLSGFFPDGCVVSTTSGRVHWLDFESQDLWDELICRMEGVGEKRDRLEWDHVIERK